MAKSNQGTIPVPTGTAEKKGIYRTFFGNSKISIYGAGWFTPEGENEPKEFQKGIKIQLSCMPKPEKIAGRELIALALLITEDPIVREELRVRQAEEKESERTL
jgi:hypothetical protein